MRAPGRSDRRGGAATSRWWIAIAIALVAIPVAAGPAAADPRVLGTWSTQADKARIALAACPNDPALLCGRIAWLANPVGADGAPLRDGRNRDAALRVRPLLGVEIVSGLRAAEPGRWRGGTVYDPERGRAFDAQLRLTGPDTLEVKGCVLLFCEAQTWRRVDPGGPRPR
ncbi:MAG TPA: DUF2147 domain-containing protein [Vineibacter sp.]|nr:DUF2147 domain-containing protein [Vineibacter sp.]